MRKSCSIQSALTVSCLAHACGSATSANNATEQAVRAESPEHVDPATTPPCPPEMALIPPEPGARTSVPWFCLDRTEVTVNAWQACVHAGACLPTPPFHPETRTTRRTTTWGSNRDDRHELPINYVNHAEADAYCGWAGKRLPSRAEWAWAYRSASSARNVPWGVWRFTSEPESLAFNVMPNEPVCRPPPNGKRLATPCPVGASPGDATDQGVLDMVGNVSEWTSERDDRTLSAEPTGEGRVSRHRICGDSFDENFFNLPVAGNCPSVPSDGAYASFGVRCAKVPDVSLPHIASFPCPILHGEQRDEALALLHEYHGLLASRAFDRALEWQTSRVDPAFFAEFRLELDFDDALIIDFLSTGGGETKRMLEGATLAPLVPDADIVFSCKNWKYTPVTQDGRPVLRVDDAHVKQLPFCLRPDSTGWVLPCILPDKSGASDEAAGLR